MRSKGFVESASLTAGSEAALSTTIKVPSGVSRLIGAYIVSEGGGLARLSADSMPADVYAPVCGYPLGTSTGQLQPVFVPLDSPVDPNDDITIYRTAAITTSSKYETVILFFE